MNSEEVRKVIEQEVDKKLREITLKLFAKSQEKIVETKAIDTGFLLKSGFWRKLGRLRYQVKYTAPYSVYLEFGTKPFFPPVEPIKKWVERKLRKHGKKAEETAWAIAHKIAKYGISPRRFMRDSIDEVIREYKKRG